MTNATNKAVYDAMEAAINALPNEGYVKGYQDGQFLSLATYSATSLICATIFEWDDEADEHPWYGDEHERDPAAVINMRLAKAWALNAAQDAFCTEQLGAA